MEEDASPVHGTAYVDICVDFSEKHITCSVMERGISDVLRLHHAWLQGHGTIVQSTLESLRDWPG